MLKTAKGMTTKSVFRRMRLAWAGVNFTLWIWPWFLVIVLSTIACFLSVESLYKSAVMVRVGRSLERRR